MRFIVPILFCVGVFVVSSFASADSLGPEDQEALQKTQKLLNSKQQRQDFIQSNDKAKRTDDMVTKLVGDGKNKEEMYKIASEIFGGMVHQQNGDADKTVSYTHLTLPTKA